MDISQTPFQDPILPSEDQVNKVIITTVTYYTLKLLKEVFCILPYSLIFLQAKIHFYICKFLELDIIILSEWPTAYVYCWLLEE